MLKLFEYNNSSNLLAVLNNAREVKILREINGAYTLSFNCPADEKADFIRVNRLVECEGQLFRIMKIVRIYYIH